MATICGGLAKSDLFIQTSADVLQIDVIRPDQAESVLLGAAMLGASAASSRNDTSSQNRFLGLAFEVENVLEEVHEESVAAGAIQVWPLTQFYSVDFSQPV